MRWIVDRTRRFQQRPYYAEHELDEQCQEIVAGFLKAKYGSAAYPITTDDLTVMIERDVAELDLYANLAGEGRGVEGVTELRHRKKPSVRIARYLSESPARENRLRSTLAHEYAHVVFHGFLWALEDGGRKPGPVRSHYRRCRRSRVVASPQTDWMEWQGRLRGRRSAHAHRASCRDSPSRPGRVGYRKARPAGRSTPLRARGERLPGLRRVQGRRQRPPVEAGLRRSRLGCVSQVRGASVP